MINFDFRFLKRLFTSSPVGVQSIAICMHVCLFVFYFICLSACISQQVSVAADRPARRGALRPPCCTQMSTVSLINWWPTTITSLFNTLTVHLSWQHLRRSTWQLQGGPKSETLLIILHCTRGITFWPTLYVVGAHQNLNDSRDLTTRLPRLFRGCLPSVG